MAKKKVSVNKSAAIRDYRQANPTAGPTEISNALRDQGVTVSPAFVSSVLLAARKKSRVDRAVETDTISVASLRKAKELADALGGIEEAKAALDALSELCD